MIPLAVSSTSKWPANCVVSSAMETKLSTAVRGPRTASTGDTRAHESPWLFGLFSADRFANTVALVSKPEEV